MSPRTKGKNFTKEAVEQLCRSVRVIPWDRVVGNLPKACFSWDCVSDRPSVERPCGSLETK